MVVEPHLDPDTVGVLESFRLPLPTPSRRESMGSSDSLRKWRSDTAVPGRQTPASPLCRAPSPAAYGTLPVSFGTWVSSAGPGLGL